MKVLNDIIAATEKVIANSEYYNPDKYKIENDGSYRAFEKHGYRIVYRYQKKYNSGSKGTAYKNGT